MLLWISLPYTGITVFSANRNNAFSFRTSDSGSNYDERSSAQIRLKSEQIMFLRQVNKHLALVFIMKEEGNEKAGFIDHNFAVFKEGIEKVFKVKNKMSNF